MNSSDDQFLPEFDSNDKQVNRRSRVTKPRSKQNLIEEVRRQDAAPHKRHRIKSERQQKEEFERRGEKLLQLDYEDFQKILLNDFKINKNSELFDSAIKLWLRKRGLR